MQGSTEHSREHLATRSPSPRDATTCDDDANRKQAPRKGAPLPERNAAFGLFHTCVYRKGVAPLAQRLEQRPFKSWVVGSNPTGGTGKALGSATLPRASRFPPHPSHRVRRKRIRPASAGDPGSLTTAIAHFPEHVPAHGMTHRPVQRPAHHPVQHPTVVRYVTCISTSHQRPLYTDVM